MAICFVSLGTVQRIPVGCRKSFCGRRERKRWEGGQSGGRVRVEMNVSIKEGYVAGGRYELLEPLGEGSTSVTYLGRDLDVEPGGKGEDVVVKVMTLKGISSWKVLELFERESRTLASISHPSIPEYLGSLQVDTEDDRIFFLVQRRAPGRTLQELVDSNWRVTPEQIRDILLQLLNVLDYLESLSPPVVHRDIKPSNIVIDVADDVKVNLVDFGAVVENIHGSRMGSTMIGTFGYMAPEQFSGVANAATDLYGLGATMVYLLTRQEPGSLPQQRLRMDFRNAVEGRFTSSETLNSIFDVVEKLTQPAPEDRFRTAKEAIDVLEGRTSLQLALPTRLPNGMPLRRMDPPKGSRISVKESETELVLTLPPSGLNAETLSTGAFALTWNGIVGAWTIGALSSGAFPFALFSVPFWVVGSQLLRRTAKGAAEEMQFTVDKIGNTLTIVSRGFGKEEVSKVSLSEVNDIRIITTAYVNGLPVKALEIDEGAKTFRLAEGLASAEIEYVHNQLAYATGKGSFGYLSEPKYFPGSAFDDRDRDFFDDRW